MSPISSHTNARGFASNLFLSIAKLISKTALVAVFSIIFAAPVVFFWGFFVSSYFDVNPTDSYFGKTLITNNQDPLIKALDILELELDGEISISKRIEITSPASTETNLDAESIKTLEPLMETDSKLAEVSVEEHAVEFLEFSKADVKKIVELAIAEREGGWDDSRGMESEGKILWATLSAIIFTLYLGWSIYLGVQRARFHIQNRKTQSHSITNASRSEHKDEAGFSSSEP